MLANDEYVCPKCRKSMVDGSGICMNCGYDTHEEKSKYDVDYYENLLDDPEEDISSYASMEDDDY